MQMHTGSPGAHRASPDQRGSALLAVVGMTVTIAMLSAIMLQQSVQNLRHQAGSTDKSKALYVAEAGLAEGLLSLRTGGSGNVGTETQPAAFGDGAFWVTTVEDANGLFHIECTSITGRARATLETIVEPVFTPVAALGLFGGSGVVVQSGATVAPYASRNDILEALIAAYGDERVLAYIEANGFPSPDQVEALLGSLGLEVPYQLVVGSNGSILVEGSGSAGVTTVQGDVIPGTEGSVEVGSGAQISGSTAPREEQAELPEIELPTLPLERAYTLAAGGRITVGPDRRNFVSVNISNRAVMRIVGPTTLLVDDLNVVSGATLEIDSTNGPVEIYTRNKLNVASGSRLVNLQQDPNGLRLFVTADDAEPPSVVAALLGGVGNLVGGLLGGTPTPPPPKVTFLPSNDAYAQIVAPKANVVLREDSRFHGSIAAEWLVVSTGADFRYDNSLLEVDEQSANLVTISWQVLEIPESVRTDLRANLVAELREANGGDLPTPSEAAQPAEYGAIYEDNEGRTMTYRGTEEDFAQRIAEVADEEARGILTRVLDPVLADDQSILTRTRKRLAPVEGSTSVRR
jgi:hypothetical protein